MRTRIPVTARVAMLDHALMVDGLKCDGCGHEVPLEAVRDWLTVGWAAGGTGRLGELPMPAHFCTAACARGGLVS